jgi:hypothetical protein
MEAAQILKVKPMRDSKELLSGCMLFGPKSNENGRAPTFRFLPVNDVLVMEKFRAMDVGLGSGVDNTIQRLFAAETKRDAKKLARSLLLTGQSFFELVANCESIGYVHDEGHRRDTPEGRALTPEERASFFHLGGSELGRKVGAKIRDGYCEQTYLSWHTFANAADCTQWHCFFYELRDVAGHPLTGVPQSDLIGPHIHYTSHRFHAVSRDELVTWMQPGATPPHDTHVRFQTSFTDKDYQGCEELLGS